MIMFTIRMLDPNGVVLHERVTDDPVWYMQNMINWGAVQQGERITITAGDPQDGYTQGPGL